MLKKIVCLCLILTVFFCGCEEEKEHGTEEYKKFSFSVESVTVSKNDRQVSVSVSANHNPGFLTMSVDIQYDSSAMSLTKVSNGSSFADYNFIPPKNTASGCTAGWFCSEVPEKVADGEIMVLTFDIPEETEEGTYSVLLTDTQDGGNVDGEKKVITFGDAIGYITIK